MIMEVIKPLTFTGTQVERLDNFLLIRLSHLEGFHKLTRSQIQSWIKKGRVTVNDKVVLKSGHSIRPKEVVRVVPLEAEPSDLLPYEYKLKILYEDKDLLVIDKPAGISMHPGAGERRRTLANALVAYLGKIRGLDPQRPGIVHRLDKDTSGVIVVAKSVAVHSDLSQQFARRSIDRRYLALVESNRGLASGEGLIETRIGRNPRKRKEMMVLKQDGRIAKTGWKVLQRFDGAALVELKLWSGRTHQIRVHMKHIGAPLLGDKVYTGSRIFPATVAALIDQLGGQALHAYLLEFSHPLTGKRLKFESPLPARFSALVDLLAGKRAAGH